MTIKKNPVSFNDLLTTLRSNPDFKAAEEEIQEKALLARNILRLRADLKMSQKELAEKAGMKQPRIADIEGMKGNPSLDTIVKVAKALNVTSADLLSAPKKRAERKKRTGSSDEASRFFEALQVTN